MDVGVGKEDDVADSGRTCCADDERGADVTFFGDDGDTDGQDRGEYVGRDGEELCGCCCVAEVLDDGGLEWVSALRLKPCMCYNICLPGRETTCTMAVTWYDTPVRTAILCNP